jgi:hypothetical protein
MRSGGCDESEQERKGGAVAVANEIRIGMTTRDRSLASPFREREYAGMQADARECDFYVFTFAMCWRVVQCTLDTQKLYAQLDA